ncbi:MAG: hypothetical protein U5P41_02990 [Gammaproteobacteria bacterium]|nr:hypothetical protein [Gammaproteobacteria bacterium]
MSARCRQVSGRGQNRLATTATSGSASSSASATWPVIQPLMAARRRKPERSSSMTGAGIAT